jgi:epoxide hydrolase
VPRIWAEKVYQNIIYWNELAKGGHFAAFEQPAIFTQELRTCFRGARGAGYPASDSRKS